MDVNTHVEERSVRIPAGAATLDGDLAIPAGGRGLVLFAHGSGSGRRSPRNRQVAAELRRGGLATILVDLLTAAEDQIDQRTRELRFNIPLLASRLVAATDWAAGARACAGLAIGCFGASTGSAAALIAAAERPAIVRAVVSRGGRPDLAMAVLAAVKAPTLLIVGGHDAQVLALNEEAYARLRCVKKLEIVPRATHLFEEPGALERVAELARAWFESHLKLGPEPRA